MAVAAGRTVSYTELPRSVFLARRGTGTKGLVRGVHLAEEYERMSIIAGHRDLCGAI